MTDAEIFELATECGMDDMIGERDDETRGRYWEGWDEQLLKFAQAIYQKGRDDGYDSVYYEHTGY
jgi:hypothetical protein